MSDLASLGLKIDSSQVPPAVAKLDELTAAGTKAEGAVDRLGDSASQTGTQIKGASAAAAEYARDVQRMATNTRLTGTHIDTLGTSTRATRSAMTNLGFQIQDIGVQLASGQNPFHILAQQGTQIYGIFSQAGDAANQLAYQVGVMIGRFLPLAAVVGAGYAALKLFQDTLNDRAPADQFVQSLGLTDKELKKLGDTSITVGHLFEGLWAVIAERTGVDESITSFKAFLIQQFVEAVSGAGRAIAALYGETVGTYRAIAIVWNDLPEMFGATFARAANAAVGKLEQFINGAIAGINRLAAAANDLLGVKLFGSIGPVTLKRVEADFSKSFGNVRGIIRGQISAATAEAQAEIDRFMADVGDAAIAARNADVQARADELIADRTSKAAKAHRDRASAADKEAEALRRLALEREKLSRREGPSADLMNTGPLKMDTSPDFGGMFANVTQEALLSPMNELLGTLQAVAEQAMVTGDIMAEAFGRPGAVIGDLIGNIAAYSAERQALSIAVLKGNVTQEQADKRLASLNARNTAMAISGVKSLFKEKSTGYKVMQAIEMAYAAFQTVNTIRSIAMDTAKTTSSVANSGVRAAADGVAAIAKAIASLPFPLNIAAGAATAAALVAFGVKVFGGGGRGGGGATPPPTSEELQEQAGTGSILGDAKAKSNSIANSLEIVAANTNKDLEYTNQMLTALRSIDTSISKLAGTVARQISVSGSMFDTSKLKLGTTGSGGFLGIGAKSTTRTLWDQGIDLQASTVADIIANGIAGNAYSVVQKVKKKSGFFGIGGGTKTTYSTTTSALDGDIASAIQEVILSLRDGLIAAADVIGLQGAEAILNSFNVSIGKISFKDMTGEQIEQQLNAIFSNIGDQMAGAIMPSLAEMQLIGEGLFETFIRVAKEYEVVDIALKSIGRTFGMVGIESVAARDHLVQLFGGIEEFMEATSFFRDEFLTEAEQMAPILASVQAEMARLGLSAVDTRDEFKAAVLGLDLTTEAGRDMYASLLAVAPAFDKVLDYFEKANKAQIDALQDTIKQFEGFATSLKKYRDTLFATDAAQGNAYAMLRAKFIGTATLAAAGDAGGLGALEGAGKDFLTASKNNASSLQQYLRDVALVARGVDQGIFAATETADYAQLQLDALENATTILGTIAQNTAAAASALGATPAVPVPAGAAPAPSTPPPPSPTDQAMLDELRALRADNAQMRETLNQMQRLWTRFDGDGLLIRTDEDTPIQVETVVP